MSTAKWRTTKKQPVAAWLPGWLRWNTARYSRPSVWVWLSLIPITIVIIIAAVGCPPHSQQMQNAHDPEPLSHAYPRPELSCIRRLAPSRNRIIRTTQNEAGIVHIVVCTDTSSNIPFATTNSRYNAYQNTSNIQ